MMKTPLGVLYLFFQIPCFVASVPVFAVLLVLTCKTNMYTFISVLLPEVRSTSLINPRTFDECLLCLLMLVPSAVLLKWALIFCLDLASFEEEMPETSSLLYRFKIKMKESPLIARVICFLLQATAFLTISGFICTKITDFIMEVGTTKAPQPQASIDLGHYLATVTTTQVLLIISTIFFVYGSLSDNERDYKNRFQVCSRIVKVTTVLFSVTYGILQEGGLIHIAAWTLVVSACLALIYMTCWTVIVLLVDVILSLKEKVVDNMLFWALAILSSIFIVFHFHGKLGFGYVFFGIIGAIILAYQIVQAAVKPSTALTQPTTKNSPPSEKASNITIFGSLVLYLLLLLSLAIIILVYQEEGQEVNQYDCQAINSWKPEKSPMAPLHSCSIQAHARGECEEDYGYDICHRSWHNLNIVDFGLLADMAYWKSLNSKCFDETFRSQFNIYFDPTDWILRGESNPDETHVGFYDLYSKSRNLSVISIRGTTSKTFDLLEDTDLFMEIALLKAVSFVVPIIHLAPDGLVANMVKLASMPSEMWFNNTKTFYYAAVLDYVKHNSSGRNVILTGHSLGAAIATIVGAKTEHTAIVFSPPGMVYSRRKFGISLTALQKYIVSVIPMRDPVPKVDKHSGLVQHISCYASNPFDCHRLRRTVCDLNQKCKTFKPLYCPT